MDKVYKKCKEHSCRDRETASGRGKSGYPPDRRELGRAGWLYLHTIAANYPETPSKDDKLKTSAFLHTFAELYPCSLCRDSLIDIYRRAPPKVNSKRDFLLWTSNIHDAVNDELGVAMQNLTYEELLVKYS